MLPAAEAITGRIAFIRGHKVLLDADLAALYGVPTGRFNEAVRRNLARFPRDFMFQLTDEEQAALRSQSAISNSGRGGRRYLPYAFTEHDVFALLQELSGLDSTNSIQRVQIRFVQIVN